MKKSHYCFLIKPFDGKNSALAWKQFVEDLLILNDATGVPMMLNSTDGPGISKILYN